jgi:hypothetical protein
MHYAVRKRMRHVTTWAAVLAIMAMASLPAARADEAQAKALFKAMSDYLSAQQTLSYDYDTTLEIVTKEKQKLGLASSGSVILTRPDKIRATRSGGFAHVEMVFDGKMLSLLGKNANKYVQADVPGTIDHLVDVLRDRFHRPLPGADLLMSDVYKQLMPLVVNVKDLGSGVIHGVECDHLAFRTREVDWQIWIAQGDRPYPCRYVVTSTKVTGAPQYSIDVRAWKTGAEVASDDFRFTVPPGATKLKPGDLPDSDELPGMFRRQLGGAKR